MIKVSVTLPGRGSVCDGEFERQELPEEMEVAPVRLKIDELKTVYLTPDEAATLGQLLLHGYQAYMKDKVVLVRKKLVTA